MLARANNKRKAAYQADLPISLPKNGGARGMSGTKRPLPKIDHSRQLDKLKHLTGADANSFENIELKQPKIASSSQSMLSVARQDSVEKERSGSKQSLRQPVRASTTNNGRSALLSQSENYGSTKPSKLAK